MIYYFCVILLSLVLFSLNFIYSCKKCKKKYNKKKISFIEKETVKEDSEIIEDEEEPPPYVEVVE